MFVVDWEKQLATCPKGHTRSRWNPAKDLRKNEVIKIKFSTTDCQACLSRSVGTPSSRHTCRTVTIRPRDQYLALMQRREQEQTGDLRRSMPREPGSQEPSDFDGLKEVAFATRADRLYAKPLARVLYSIYVGTRHIIPPIQGEDLRALYQLVQQGFAKEN